MSQPLSDPRSLPRVLYIEDNDSARLLVRRLLEGRYVVLEAADPLDGLQLAEETHPHIVLLDHNLPHMTGREAATRLSKILPNVPLVIVSADTSGNARERALAAGAVGFIPKPIEVDTFREQVDAYLHGRREKLEQADRHHEAYQQELVERLENNVRQLSHAAERNKYLLQQNERMLSMLERRHKLLEMAARVGQAVTSILDLDELLEYTVNVVCKEFELYYSGVFLVAEDNHWAVLRAGYGEAGRAMLEEQFRLPVDDKSMIGQAIRLQQAQIALDVEGEISHFKNPHLPATRSEMALPLIVKSLSLGALTVQSERLKAFTEEDITSLQTMADQVAVAINNAQLLAKLEAATAELVRTKTYEAIATATGEAIHWVGNKAAPITGSVRRVREDLSTLLAVLWRLRASGAELGPLDGIIHSLLQEAAEGGLELEKLAGEMSAYSPKRLAALLSVESLLEDLKIIEHSAVTILKIKEDLIGPARQMKPGSVSLFEMLETMISDMGLPRGVVSLDLAENLPNVYCDARQVEQVFNNLVKNAWEALEGRPESRITVRARLDKKPDHVLVAVSDNGPGIPPEIQERIWVSFFTTKGDHGGTGLGLSACTQIVTQNRGKIWLESEIGKGATFFVRLPTKP
ncbi:MAG: response regulator [Chloroflexi bacterium]|nr:response regulator [Chloroflexota bacterium]